MILDHTSWGSGEFTVITTDERHRGPAGLDPEIAVRSALAGNGTRDRVGSGRIEPCLDMAGRCSGTEYFAALMIYGPSTLDEKVAQTARWTLFRPSSKQFTTSRIGSAMIHRAG